MTVPAGQFDGTHLVLPGGVVLLRGQALADVVTALRLAVQTQRGSGYPTPSRLLDLSAACSTGLSETSTGSVPGSAEYRATAGLPACELTVGVSEAALLLGISSRRVRFIAEELGGRKVRGSWKFDRTVLEQEARRRRGQ